MSVIGNIIWILLGGIWMSLGWVIAGVIMQSVFRLTARRRPAGSGKACHRAGD